MDTAAVQYLNASAARFWELALYEFSGMWTAKVKTPDLPEGRRMFIGSILVKCGTGVPESGKSLWGSVWKPREIWTFCFHIWSLGLGEVGIFCCFVCRGGGGG